MDRETMLSLFHDIADHSCSPQDALDRFHEDSITDLGYAKIDTQRSVRQGAQEVIYGAGKTDPQIIGILDSMAKNGALNIIVTRISKDTAAEISDRFPFQYNEQGRIGIACPSPIEMTGSIVIASGGTSDIPVCEEAAVTAEALGNNVRRLYDVGVSGVHRLLHNADLLLGARVIIAVAGMEGALASVIGGLADCPVIAVPTSVGYGANFGGVSALLSMLNSCASGVSVVNIDNGFGAAYQASMINKMK